MTNHLKIIHAYLTYNMDYAFNLGDRELIINRALDALTIIKDLEMSKVSTQLAMEETTPENAKEALEALLIIAEEIYDAVNRWMAIYFPK